MLVPPGVRLPAKDAVRASSVRNEKWQHDFFAQSEFITLLSATQGAHDRDFITIADRAWYQVLPASVNRNTVGPGWPKCAGQPGRIVCQVHETTTEPST